MFLNGERIAIMDMVHTCFMNSLVVVDDDDSKNEGKQEAEK